MRVSDLESSQRFFREGIFLGEGGVIWFIRHVILASSITDCKPISPVAVWVLLAELFRTWVSSFRLETYINRSSFVMDRNSISFPISERVRTHYCTDLIIHSHQGFRKDWSAIPRIQRVLSPHDEKFCANFFRTWKVSVVETRQHWPKFKLNLSIRLEWWTKTVMWQSGSAPDFEDMI